MLFPIAKPLILALLTAVLALPAAAEEELSVNQLKKLFDQQRSVFKEAETNGLGATRGLKLITVDDVSAQGAAESTVASTSTVTSRTGNLADTALDTGASATSETTVPDTGTELAAATSAPAEVVVATAGPSDPNKPLVFGQLAPELQVNLHIKFGFDSAALSADETPKLEKMCQVLKQSDIKLVRIVGHTDASGGADYNERLSVLRAKEVARHLVEKCDINPARLETLGLGERFPFNAIDTRADENRRVEFQALS